MDDRHDLADRSDTGTNTGMNTSSNTGSTTGHERHAHAGGDGDGDGKSWWATTWPIDTSRTKKLVAAGVGLVAVLVLFGSVLYRLTDPNPVTDADQSIAEWLVEQRTSTFDELAHWGSFISDTITKIVMSVAVVAFALWRWRRWHEAVLIGVSLIFEATVFIVSSTIVGRSRPDVERLASSPVDTSFPSGHVAAAACYFAFTVVVFWHTRAVWARVLAVLFGVATTGIVGWARAYEGMHYFTDVVVGAILGLVSVWICVRILGAPHDAVVRPLDEERNPDRRPAAAA